MLGRCFARPRVSSPGGPFSCLPARRFADAPSAPPPPPLPPAPHPRTLMPPKTPRNDRAWFKRTLQDIEDKGIVKVISMAPAATEADKKSSLLKGVPFLHFVDPNVEDIDVVNRPRKEPRPSRNRPPKPRPQTFFPSAVYQMRTFSRPMDPSKLLFRVPIKTNKIMIKHYLSSIYGLDITKVNTVNYDGERKRVHGKRGEWYQKPGYKKAIVTLAKK